MYNIKSAEPTINNNQFEYWKGNSMKILNLQLFSKRYFIPIEFYTHYLFFFMKYIMESIIWKELAWELRNVVPIISLLLSTCVIIGNWPKAIYSFKTWLRALPSDTFLKINDFNKYEDIHYGFLTWKVFSALELPSFLDILLKSCMVWTFWVSFFNLI